VALKPGKPICLAVVQGKPVVILPGFPTSAIFTFHEFVAPVLRALAGRRDPGRAQISATLPMRVNSERGRTEYLLVSLVKSSDIPVVDSSAIDSIATPASPPLFAFPMGKGSGSVTTFSCADGFITIDQHTEILEAGASVTVQLLGRDVSPADLVVIGSHCVGLDYLLGCLQRRGYQVKSLHVGSTAGLTSVSRGQCDLAGIHLLDPATGEYNRPFLTPGLELIPGYRRMQGLVFRPGDSRFVNKTSAEALAAALSDPACRMINRNPGSGTRILFDRLLADAAGSLSPRVPSGYAVQAKSHNAVAAAIQQHRADWGVAINTVARDYGLGFVPLREEHYDFAFPRSRENSPALVEFRRLLSEPATRTHLQSLGFNL
jgi:putative molybdopterin biosynthesis protein